MKFFSKVKGSLDMATRKSQDALEINKLNNQIKKLEGDADKLYQSMGEQVYRDPALEKQETRNHIQAQIQAIDHLQRQIREMRAKVLYLKDLIECESCQKVVALETKFCPDCGNNIADQVKRTSKILAISQHNEPNP